LTRLRWKLFPLTPSIRPNIFYPSLTIAFALMLTLCAQPLQVIKISDLHSTFIDDLCRWVLDESIIQAISLAGLIVVAARYFGARAGMAGMRRYFFFGILFSFFHASALMLDAFFLKLSFRYAHPPALMPEALLTRLTVAAFPHLEANSISAPSGYVMRQTMILLTFLLISHQKAWRKFVIRPESRRYLHWGFYGLWALVIALRLYRGYDTFFDVGIGIGVGALVFWTVTVFTVSLVLRDRSAKAALVDAAAPTLTFGIAVLFYCQETSWWILVLVGLLVSMAFISALPLAPLQEHATE
jgi:hypothetical protein